MKINPITNNYHNSFKAKLSPEVLNGFKNKYDEVLVRKGENAAEIRENYERTMNAILDYCPNATVHIETIGTCECCKAPLSDFVILEDGKKDYYAGCREYNRENLFKYDNLRSLLFALGRKQIKENIKG